MKNGSGRANGSWPVNDAPEIVGVKKINSLDELRPDEKNANRGTERGAWQLEESLRRFGAGRSILVDKNGKTIAGNKTLEQSVSLGLGVRVVETDGNELVVVQRMDVDLDNDTDHRARGLAYADNIVASHNLDWDAEVLAADLDAGLDVLEDFFTEDELEKIIAQGQESMPEVGDAPSETMGATWGVILMCDDEAEQLILLERFHQEGLNCRALMG